MKKNRDAHDLIGGLAVAATGAFFAIYGSRYAMGTAARMGAGYFPVILGWILAVLGLLVALPAWRRPGSPIVVQWRSLFSAVLGVVAFAALLKPAGIVLASIATCLIALIPTRMALRQRLAVSVLVAALTALMFVAGLRMPLSVWPLGL
jgi:hypothetical protein